METLETLKNDYRVFVKNDYYLLVPHSNIHTGYLFDDGIIRDVEEIEDEDDTYGYVDYVHYITGPLYFETHYMKLIIFNVYRDKTLIIFSDTDRQLDCEEVDDVDQILQNYLNGDFIVKNCEFGIRLFKK